MVNGIIGRKLGVTQYFRDNGDVVPVTVLTVGPCHVVQRKTVEKDGYASVQLGYDKISPRRLNKPLSGHFEKNDVIPTRILKEFIEPAPEGYKPGESIKIGDVFKRGDLVNIRAVSKGKGFAGVIKRWGFKGGPKSHGSMLHRAPGSIGSSATPSRVLKGKKLPGRMGGKYTTVRNLEIVEIDPEVNLILVKGAVPGRKNAIVFLYSTGKQAKGKSK